MDASNHALMGHRHVVMDWRGLCVTCVHHGSAQRAVGDGSYADFLTCKKLTVRSPVNGAVSNLCGDVRVPGDCAGWENDRGCARCKWVARGGFLQGAQCMHPTRLTTYGEDGPEYLRGRTLGVDCHPVVYSANVTSYVDTGKQACGEGVPDWEDGT